MNESEKERLILEKMLIEAESNITILLMKIENLKRKLNGMVYNSFQMELVRRIYLYESMVEDLHVQEAYAKERLKELKP